MINCFYQVEFPQIQCFRFLSDGMSFGLGSFLGASVRIRAMELGLYGTAMFNHNRYVNDFRWFSLTLSKSFPVIKSDK
jgi:hypothetical protein